MAATTTIRVPNATHQRLQRIASAESRPIGKLIDKLIDDYEKRAFFEGLGQDFERLQADPETWAEFEADVRLWDSTLLDGLLNEPVFE